MKTSTRVAALLLLCLMTTVISVSEAGSSASRGAKGGRRSWQSYGTGRMWQTRGSGRMWQNSGWGRKLLGLENFRFGLSSAVEDYLREQQTTETVNELNDLAKEEPAVDAAAAAAEEPAAAAAAAEPTEQQPVETLSSTDLVSETVDSAVPEILTPDVTEEVTEIVTPDVTKEVTDVVTPETPTTTAVEEPQAAETPEDVEDNTAAAAAAETETGEEQQPADAGSSSSSSVEDVQQQSDVADQGAAPTRQLLRNGGMGGSANWGSSGPRSWQITGGNQRLWQGRKMLGVSGSVSQQHGGGGRFGPASEMYAGAADRNDRAWQLADSRFGNWP